MCTISSVTVQHLDDARVGALLHYYIIPTSTTSQKSQVINCIMQSLIYPHNARFQVLSSKLNYMLVVDYLTVLAVAKLRH